MEKKVAIILLIIFLIFVFLIMRRLYIKATLHFRLLKILFPEKLNNVETYFQLMWLPNTFKLSFDVLIWFWLPMYYTKEYRKLYDKNAMKLHLKLKDNNKKLGIIVLSFIIFMSLFWIITIELNG